MKVSVRLQEAGRTIELDYAGHSSASVKEVLLKTTDVIGIIPAGDSAIAVNGEPATKSTIVYDGDFISTAKSKTKSA